MTIEQLEQLINEGGDVNLLTILSFPKGDLERAENPKIKNWIASCIRKQYLTEEYSLTIEGKKILDKYLEGKKTEEGVIDKNVIKDKFEEWWSIYPSTDYFVHKGITFAGTQAKKIYKTVGGKSSSCWDSWRKIINEGEYSPDDIIRATKFHIDTAKELSIKKKDNQLTYIPNSARYLSVKSFMPYVEISKQQKIKTIDNNTTFEL